MLARGGVYFISFNHSQGLMKYTKVVLVRHRPEDRTVYLLKLDDLAEATHWDCPKLQRKIFQLPRFPTEFTPSGKKFSVILRQYPLLYTSGHSVHKAQAATMEKAVINIQASGFFSHGQGEVAVSNVNGRHGVRFWVGEVTRRRHQSVRRRGRC